MKLILFKVLVYVFCSKRIDFRPGTPGNDFVTPDAEILPLLTSISFCSIMAGSVQKCGSDGSSDGDEVDELADLTLSPCPASPRMRIKTLDEALAIAEQAKSAHDAARADLERATAAFVAAKKAGKKKRARMKFPDRYTQGDLKAALAPKAAKVKAAEDKFAEARSAMLTASDELDLAKLRALSAKLELTNTEKNPGARIIQQVLDNSELEREFCARHPRWRANLQTEGLGYKRVEDVYVLHSGHGGIGRRRNVAYCGVVSTKHNVWRSRYCRLVIRQSTLEMHFEFEEKTRIQLGAASTMTVKGLPNMPARVELVNEDGQHMWLWDVSPQVLPVIVQAYQSMMQSKPHAAPTLPPIEVASDCRYCPIAPLCIGTMAIRQSPLCRLCRL